MKHYPIPVDDWNRAVHMEFLEREAHILNDIHDRNNPKPVRKRLPKHVRGITLKGGE